MADHFQIASADAIITNNKRTASEKGGFNCNAYGMQLIKCKKNINCYRWKIKIESMNDSAYIGIDDGNALSLDDYDCFAHKRSTNNYSYSYDGYIQCLGTESFGNLPSLKANDLMEITLSLSDKTLSFALNGKCVRTVKNIITTNDQTYRLAVYVSMASVSIIEFEQISKQNEVKNKEEMKNDSGLMNDDLLDIFLSSQMNQNLELNENGNKLDDKSEKVKTVNSNDDDHKYEINEDLLKEVDLSEYKEWNEQNVIDWLLSIEDGILLAFESEVKKDVIKHKITGKNLQNFDKDKWLKLNFIQFVGVDAVMDGVKQLQNHDD